MGKPNRYGSHPFQERFVCTGCWYVHDGADAECCAYCKKSAPEGGWAALGRHRVRDRFLLLRLIDRGSWGAVFVARDREGDRDGPVVALKLISTKYGPKAFDIMRPFFAQESAIASLVARSGYFVKFYCADHTGAVPYLAMAYMDPERGWSNGRELFRRRAALGSSSAGELSATSSGALTHRETVDLGAELLEGLSRLHHMHFVHRDLKPANFFVRRATNASKHSEVRIGDLGLTIFCPPDCDNTLVGDARESAALTRGELGTIAYMSPEQLSKAALLSPQSDLFSVGCILWEAFTGERPFPATGRGPESQKQSRRAAMARPLEKPPGMPEPLYYVLQRALRLAPEERWESALEMRAALEDSIADPEVQERRAQKRAARRLEELRAELEAAAEELAEPARIHEKLVSTVQRADTLRTKTLDSSLPLALVEEQLEELEKQRASLTSRFATLRPGERLRTAPPTASWERGASGPLGAGGEPRLTEATSEDENRTPKDSADALEAPSRGAPQRPAPPRWSVAALALLVGLGAALGGNALWTSLQARTSEGEQKSQEREASPPAASGKEASPPPAGTQAQARPAPADQAPQQIWIDLVDPVAERRPDKCKVDIYVESDWKRFCEELPCERPFPQRWPFRLRFEYEEGGPREYEWTTRSAFDKAFPEGRLLAHTWPRLKIVPVLPGEDNTVWEHVEAFVADTDNPDDVISKCKDSPCFIDLSTDKPFLLRVRTRHADSSRWTYTANYDNRDEAIRKSSKGVLQIDELWRD